MRSRKRLIYQRDAEHEALRDGFILGTIFGAILTALVCWEVMR